MLRIVLLTVIFTFAFGELPLKTCESSIGHILNASVTGAKVKHGKYILKRGTKAGIDINFITEKKIKEVNAFAKVTMAGVEMSSPLPEMNGCKVLKCPLKKGGKYFYKATLPVENYYPTIETVATLELRNENEDIIVCLIIPVIIK